MRITELRSRSTMIYLTILSTLFSGIFVIIFASNLASRDSTMARLLAAVDSERRAALEDLAVHQRTVPNFSDERYVTADGSSA